MSRRVVITGIGIMTPIGNSTLAFWGNLLAGESGIRMHPDAEINVPVGWVEFDPSTRFSKIAVNTLDRVSQLAIVAADTAVRQAGFPGFGDNAGVYFGTGMGGASSAEQAYAHFFNAGGQKRKLLTVPAAMTHAAASQVAIAHGVTGECQTYSTACASSATAIGEAYRRIRDGYMLTALAGGAECILTPGILHTWKAMRVLCPDSKSAPGTGCRPFSADRLGFYVGEGAAVLVLEQLEQAISRGAMPLAEIVGYGMSNDATHITKPNPDGQSLAIRRALSEARITPRQIGHINAHGTATTVGDIAEAAAIRTVFHEVLDIPVTATKSSHGHLMGATGAVEFIAMMLSLRDGLIPPIANFTTPDPLCHLNVVRDIPLEINTMEYALSNSFAFGGSNIALIARRWT